MKKLLSFLLAGVLGLTAFSSNAYQCYWHNGYKVCRTPAHHCYWVKGHWYHGHYYRSHRVCTYK